jgi:hypothetical protein
VKSQSFFSLLAAGFIAGNALLDPNVQKIDAKHLLSREKQSAGFTVENRLALELQKVKREQCE